MNSPDPVASLAVLPAGEADRDHAASLARRLALPLLDPCFYPADLAEPVAVLLVAGGELSLCRTGRGAPGPVSVDFGSAAMRHRRKSGHNELLGRAVGVGRKPGLRVLDATAGLGRDSFVLADLGCRLTLCEREPVIAAMLSSALETAITGEDAWLATVARRMQLHRGDARDLASSVRDEQDVIYLDPMFPQRDKHAAVKKEMALFQQLLYGHYPQGDAQDLLAWALQQAVVRVVVKRPPRAGHLGDRPPTHQLSSKTVRYDVYTLSSWQRD